MRQINHEIRRADPSSATTFSPEQMVEPPTLRLAASQLHLRDRTQDQIRGSDQTSTRDSVRDPKLRELNDREAVIAVMIANGLTHEDIALRLALPVIAVENHLRQALGVLGLADEHHLTYVVVASHYNRNAPSSPTSPRSPSDHGRRPDEGSVQLGQKGPNPAGGSERTQSSGVPDPEDLDQTPTGIRLNSLVILDAAQERHEQGLEPFA